MRYQTDPMTQIEEKWLKSRKVSILDIFWRLIMLIMQNWDFSGSWGLLQMLINTLYLLNMRYGTDAMTQFWAKCEKPRFWANFDIIMLIMRKRDFFQKSEFVTFLDLLKPNLMQKNQKNLMMGGMRTFVTDRHERPSGNFSRSHSHIYIYTQY